jgi:hypothetical protein
MSDLTREEHLAWCKRRALEYLDAGEITNAITSMMSDMDKHPETRCNNKVLAHLGMLIAVEQNADAARRFIEGWR